MTRQFLDFLFRTFDALRHLCEMGVEHTVMLGHRYGELFDAVMHRAPNIAPLVRDCTIDLVILVLLAGLFIIVVLLPLLSLLRAIFSQFIETVRDYGLFGLLLILLAVGVCAVAGVFLGDLVHDLYHKYLVEPIPFLQPISLRPHERTLLITLASLSVFWLGIGEPAGPVKLLIFALPLGTLCCTLVIPTMTLFVLALLTVPANAYSLKPLDWVRWFFGYLKRRPRRRKR